MRVLLIEDDAATAQVVELMLRSEGWNVVTTDLGKEGLSMVLNYEYDIVLLDINLPDISGYEVLKSLRTASINIAVIILSGLAAIEDKVAGLRLGADDYMTKPFHKDELVARMHAVTRRYHGRATPTVKLGNMELNLDMRVAKIGGKLVHLTGKEYRTLEFLGIKLNAVATKEGILDYLYGGMDEPELKIVDVFICKLRKKLKDAGAEGFAVETIWGRGWTLRGITP